MKRSASIRMRDLLESIPLLEFIELILEHHLAILFDEEMGLIEVLARGITAKRDHGNSRDMAGRTGRREAGTQIP